MKTNNFCFYLQNRLIQTGQTGGQWYSDTSPFSIPWLEPNLFRAIQFFNEADTLESSSLLIYLAQMQKIYIQSYGSKPY